MAIGQLIDLPGVRRVVDFPGKPLWVFFDPLKQVYYLAVQVVDRLYVAPGFIKQNSAGSKKWLQVRVVCWEKIYDPPGYAPFTPLGILRLLSFVASQCELYAELVFYHLLVI